MARKHQRLRRDEVLEMLKEAGLTTDPHYEVGMSKQGTLTFDGGYVAFLGTDGFYSRDEVCRFISDHREG